LDILISSFQVMMDLGLGKKETRADEKLLMFF